MVEFTSLLKICVFADKDVGKKTLARSNFVYNYDYVEDYMSTIGVELCTKTIDYHKGIRLQLWIISDKEYHADTWKPYINGSHGVILMYDITNAKTLDRLSAWCQLTKNYDKNVPILLVGNKSDLEENREVSKEQVERFKQDNNMDSSTETSIKTGENVEEMFLKILSMILNIGIEDLKAGIIKRQEEKLEERRENLIRSIENVIKNTEKKLKGKRNLKKLERFWSKNFGKTASFEEFVDRQKKHVLNLAECKNEMIHAKDHTEIMKVCDKVKRLLFIINFSG